MPDTEQEQNEMDLIDDEEFREQAKIEQILRDIHRIHKESADESLFDPNEVFRQAQILDETMPKMSLKSKIRIANALMWVAGKYNNK